MGVQSGLWRVKRLEAPCWPPISHIGCLNATVLAIRADTRVRGSQNRVTEKAKRSSSLRSWDHKRAQNRSRTHASPTRAQERSSFRVPAAEVWAILRCTFSPQRRPHRGHWTARPRDVSSHGTKIRCPVVSQELTLHHSCRRARHHSHPAKLLSVMPLGILLSRPLLPIGSRRVPSSCWKRSGVRRGLTSVCACPASVAEQIPVHVPSHKSKSLNSARAGTGSGYFRADFSCSPRLPSRGGTT